MTLTRQIHLIARPEGAPEPQHFALREVTLPPPADGEVLADLLWLSIDPYMRGRMRAGKSYVPAFALDAPMSGGMVARVRESASPGLMPGDLVTGHGPWAEQAILRASDLQVLPAQGIGPQAYLSVLGMPGFTAWVGLNFIAAAQPGETILVSAASGAVGSLVCQLARQRGLRVIGVAGGAEKCARAVSDYGCERCLDHRGKSAAELSREMAAAAPEGYDIYFDNVGGTTLEAVLPRMKDFGRIALCGAIAWYNDPASAPPAAQIWLPIIGKRLRVQGFIVSDHDHLRDAFLDELGPLVRAGEIAWRDSLALGLEAAPGALIGLLRGENDGKQLVQIA